MKTNKLNIFPHKLIVQFIKCTNKKQQQPENRFSEKNYSYRYNTAKANIMPQL